MHLILSSSFSVLIIGAVVIVWRARGKIFRSVLCSILCNNCTQWTAHTYEHWTDLTVLWIGFCLTGPISLCVDSFLCMYNFVSDCTLHACVLCSIVTQWAGPGGIEAWSLGPLLPSVLWHCWLGKPVPDMTCNVFSGTLNPTQSINQSTMQSNEQHFIIVITFRLNYHSD